MAPQIAWFILGLVVLALGGDSLVRAASGLARRLGLPPFAIGLVLVALATSIPELVVNFYAVAHGQGDLALGNAVGSNVVNIGLTLAVAAMVAPLLVRWRALATLLAVLLGATLVVILFSLDGRISALEGGLLVIAFLALLAVVLKRASGGAPDVREQIEAYTRTSDVLGLNLIRLAVGGAFLGYGAWLIVRNAGAVGDALHLSPLLTGLLPIAIATALPEMAAAISAARRGHGDMVAGHVIGSSLVNVLLVIGGMAVIGGGLAIPASFVRYELPAALVFGLMLLPVLRGDMRVSRNEGIALFVAMVAWVAFEVVLVSH